MIGNIHSIETFGTVDGPGIRFVIFMQGCPMRCLYCHNPDTWEVKDNKKFTVDEILKQYDNVKEFCKGGITVTGGEPLLQIDFVTELFKKAKEKNIHTCLDTSGITFIKEKLEKFNELIKYTDLVLLDIKHINNKEHIKLTKHPNTSVIEFARYLSDNNIPVWIRHVVVPTLTDNEQFLAQLGKFLKTLKNIRALDVLPYHNMAISKYENLDIEYPLLGVSALSKEDTIKARNIILRNM